MTDKIGLYIHIPFCKSKCAYCDFYSSVCLNNSEEYTKALVKQLSDNSQALKNREVDTVYIGGGTPSIMPIQQMLSVLREISKDYRLSNDCEFSMEANPATVSFEMLKEYRENGVNRLSLGLQSAVKAELSELGRIHDFEGFKQSYSIARDAGIDNINVDLMYGIPHQTPQSLDYSLSRVIELAPEHISLYGLKIEDNTVFGRKRDSLALPSEDEECEMYLNSINKLSQSGYEQYEISNFSKKGYNCRHNLRYWHGKEYIGFGPGAHSYINGKRFSYKKSTSLFIDAICGKRDVKEIVDEDYILTEKEKLGEYIMLHLRLCRGIDISELKTRFDYDFEKENSDALKNYLSMSYIKKTEKGYAFTPKGMLVSNYILSDLCEFE